MPLVLPQQFIDPCLCSIDPGTNCLGFTHLVFESETLAAKRFHSTTFKAETILGGQFGIVSQSHSERMEKIMLHKDNLLRLFQFYQPSVIACEAPFYNRLRPGAYGPLVEVIMAVKMAALEYDPLVPMIMYEPSIVKKTIRAGYIASKDVVKESILNTEELRNIATQDLTLLDEHSIDSLAVGYTYLLLNRKGLV